MMFFSPTFKKIFSLVLVFVGALSLSGCGFKQKAPESYAVDLEVWGVFDDSDAYAELFSEYRKYNPYVRSLTYRKMPVETYKEDVLNALAAGKGPDIFMIRNAWRGAFEDKIVSVPEQIPMTERQYRDTFVDVAASDFIGTDGKIYGAPLSVDSLALYYNKDIFNAAGITAPPTTWEDLLSMVGILNRVDEYGNITQSGVALGTAYNINRSTDILTALMLQLGSNIGESEKSRLDLSDNQSRMALDFYTQFANAGTGLYSWNPRLHYSIDSFYEGTLGMMVNYSWQYATLKQKNAKLNIGVAPLPQFSGKAPSNFANYWGFVVSKNKEYQPPQGKEGVRVDVEKQNFLRVHEAWQLLKYLTFPPQNKTFTLINGIAGTTKDFPLAFDPAEKYLQKTMKPAARRDLIEKQRDDVVLSPFALGNLIAKNWYQGNPEGVEQVFGEMIDSVNNGWKNSYDALLTAKSRINVLKR